MRRFASALLTASALFVAAGLRGAPAAADSDVPAPPAPAVPAVPAPVEVRCVTPVQLFAAVEDAWFRTDADRLAALVDTASVHIAVKPGAPPAAAMTRGAAAFLFQDQLRLVRTQSFQIVRVNVGRQSGTAIARWTADWGGRQGVRTVDVSLVAAPVVGRWLLTEVRVRD